MRAAGSFAKAVAALACALGAWLTPGVGAMSVAPVPDARGAPGAPPGTPRLFVAAASAEVVRDAEPAGTLDASPHAAPRYRLDPRHSGVTFRVDNFWHAHLTMRFTRMRAELAGIDDDGLASRVDVTVDAASLGANVPFVAALLKGSAMLDVARYPEIRFVGTRFERTGATEGRLTGDLTIRSTTRPITLAVRFAAGQPGTGAREGVERGAARPRAEWGQRESGSRDARTLAFVADGHFSRAAFGLSRWLPAVGDDVRMRIRAEFVRERAEP
ncbi:YceI family protein [Burkholderia thailandensis]|nr:YceI family protein [Burkholderia thailandensis]AHI75547.1 yceI-like domain protein [Burkholderia thailandensis 2002721723]AIC91231.1 yceI-like domain protein [Burkholderia thailandensis USAMRU Malaysia \